MTSNILLLIKLMILAEAKCARISVSFSLIFVEKIIQNDWVRVISWKAVSKITKMSTIATYKQE